MAAGLLMVLSYLLSSMTGLIEGHHELGSQWETVGDWVKWLEQCQVTAVEGAEIFQSLW